jgi:hypothetical protein
MRARTFDADEGAGLVVLGDRVVVCTLDGDGVIRDTGVGRAIPEHQSGEPGGDMLRAAGEETGSAPELVLDLLVHGDWIQALST